MEGFSGGGFRLGAVVAAVAPGEDGVVGLEIARLDVFLGFQFLPERDQPVEIQARPGLYAVEDEIGLLEVVDPVEGAHDAAEVEADPVRGRALEGEHRLAGRRGDAGAHDPQALGGLGEADPPPAPSDPPHPLPPPAPPRTPPPPTHTP